MTLDEVVVTPTDAGLRVSAWIGNVRASKILSGPQARELAVALIYASASLDSESTSGVSSTRAKEAQQKVAKIPTQKEPMPWRQ